MILAFNGALYRAETPVEMTVTAYTAGIESTGKRPGDKGYGITRSGTTATEGRTIAVDPSVIPLGAWVYIEGMGYRRAEDTGGLVNGRHIDIFMTDVDTALQFGVRKVQVYLVGRPYL